MDRVEQEIIEMRERRCIKRTGKCLQCGKCCEGKVKIYAIKEDTVVQTKTSDKLCYYYDKKTKTCKNYNNRPTWCTMFPYVPEVMYEGCGYKFETTIESEKLKKFKSETKDEISTLNYKKYFYQFSEVEKYKFAKEMKNIEEYFKKELELDIYPVYGTLLGITRDDDFINWDTDIDMAYLSKCRTKEAVLNEWNMICKFLEEKQLLMKKIKTASHAHVYSPNRELRIDLWISWIDEKDKYHIVWTVAGDLDGNMILPFTKIEFKGQSLNMMNDPIRFLNAHYNWKVPTQGGLSDWARRNTIFELEQWIDE